MVPFQATIVFSGIEEEADPLHPVLEGVTPRLCGELLVPKLVQGYDGSGLQLVVVQMGRLGVLHLNQSTAG